MFDIRRHRDADNFDTFINHSPSTRFLFKTRSSAHVLNHCIDFKMKKQADKCHYLLLQHIYNLTFASVNSFASFIASAWMVIGNLPFNGLSRAPSMVGS